MECRPILLTEQRRVLIEAAPRDQRKQPLNIVVGPFEFPEIETVDYRDQAAGMIGATATVKQDEG